VGIQAGYISNNVLSSNSLSTHSSKWVPFLLLLLLLLPQQLLLRLPKLNDTKTWFPVHGILSRNLAIFAREGGAIPGL
jgi:hypothetical protein